MKNFTSKIMHALPVIPAIILIALYCYGREVRVISDHPEEVKFIQKTWNEFVRAVEKKDHVQMKSLIMDSIRCYLCLENTERESCEMDKLRETNPDWYSIVYNKKINIPSDRFIDDDVPILFDGEMIRRLKKGRTVYSERDVDGIIHYEILVTTSEANEVYKGLEGVQHVFEFMKTDKGYRLKEISTIP